MVTRNEKLHKKYISNFIGNNIKFRGFSPLLHIQYIINTHTHTLWTMLPKRSELESVLPRA